ncbi:hypothetical protein SS1G_00652 [Sclerotinia sclerotiorum 1980 UF-70]|uniref:Uncharacterized protein n=1 Tax=Sclerotinia sclerotiorum (strain ATCC 18683 / 1980 / Ss-1) TaxID=665079 RepID=A7E5S7_SCLS1|nr:hypothetical protein SS1G_00652 [Sclerotinia sclerotiorum 1980 UF-70]EDN91249.1 hypothetical protein SS1G_00652 [Sclerotinia sclerotiorum 1980 UF-70]
MALILPVGMGRQGLLSRSPSMEIGRLWLSMTRGKRSGKGTEDSKRRFWSHDRFEVAECKKPNGVEMS